MRAFKSTIVESWRLRNPVEIQELSKNLYLFVFSTKRDLESVLKMGPWSFDRSILVLKRISGTEQPSEMAMDSVSFWTRVYDLPLVLRTDQMAERIGNLVGKYEEADKLETHRLGKFLRLKVSIDLKKPLKRGTVLRFQGKDLRVDFKYERLPTFCFVCGMIGHQLKDCEEAVERYDEGFEGIDERELPFGHWLRASPLPKQNPEQRRDSNSGSCSKTLFATSSNNKTEPLVEGKGETEVDQDSIAVEKPQGGEEPPVVGVAPSLHDIERIAESLGSVNKE